MIGDKETSEERRRCFIKHLLEVAVAFKKLQISPIITHPVQGGGLHRNLLFDGPDPSVFFLPNIKEKKRSGYARLTFTHCNFQLFLKLQPIILKIMPAY